MTVTLTYQQARALQLRLRGHGLADIARDLKLDGCLVSYTAALKEAREILDSAAEALDAVTGFGHDDD